MSIPITEKHIKLYLFAYLLFSLGFSFLIFLKLIFAFSGSLLNTILYDVYYYVMPSIAILILISLSKPEPKKLPKWQACFSVAIWTLLIAVLSWAFLLIDNSLNTPLSYAIFQIMPVVMAFLYFKGKVCKDRLLSKKIATFSLAFVILMPYAVVFLGANSALSVARAVESETERIEFVSNYVRTITTSFWGLEGFERQYQVLHRASSDFLKFLMVGAGSCGEMAHAAKSFFDDLDLESRVVSFPGEDHMFVEVKLSDTWLVVDPGYGLTLVTREERGSRRLRSLGGLSYVVAYTDQGLIEVTNHYVTTDQITIRVTDSGEPMAKAEVILKHTFMGNTRSLPEFYTDATGSIELSLGPLTYNNTKVEPVEAYYWIWVNGRNTDLKVGSTGSGKSVLIEVDLAEEF